MLSTLRRRDLYLWLLLVLNFVTALTCITSSYTTLLVINWFGGVVNKTLLFFNSTDTSCFFFKKKDPADLVTFTEEILNVKLHFLCSVPP